MPSFGLLGVSQSDPLTCGISFPQRAYPGSNMSDCCTSAVWVYDGCVHYCRVDDEEEFGRCVDRTIFHKQSHIRGCNKSSDSGSASSRFGGSWKLGGIVALIGAAALFT